MPGWYPQLEDTLSKRIREVDPTSSSSLTPAERTEASVNIASDLDAWIYEISESEQNLKNNLETPAEKHEEIPKLVHSTIELGKNISRIKSDDYRAWDKLDVDDGIQILEKTHPTQINSKEAIPEIPADLRAQERSFLAENERFKGNECISANELDEAVSNYFNLVDPLFHQFNIIPYSIGVQQSSFG
jgi:hypothetical protein